MTVSREALAADLAARHDLDEMAAAEAVTIYAQQLGVPDGDLTDTDAEHIDLALQAHLAHDTGRTLDVVAEATTELAAARRRVDELDAAWRAAIKAAIGDGQRVVDIAEAAGISRERVYQIHKNRR